MYPSALALDIPDIFGREPVCLFQFCAQAELGLPSRFFCMKKKEVTSREGRWVCEYEEGLVVFLRIHVDGGAPCVSGVNRGRARSAQADSRAQAREFREAFGEIGYGSDSSESTAIEDLSEIDDFEEKEFAMGQKRLFGYSENEELSDEGRHSRVGSADELVRRIKIPDDDRVVMLGKLAQAIDFGRYIPTVGSKTGIVTVWSRTDA